MNGLKVKICGITNLEDARAAVEAGADALGFMFYRQSPRCVSPKAVREIVAQLPPLVVSVGIFVNEEEKVVREIMDACGLAVAQLHGDETPAFCHALERPVLRAIRLRDRGSLLAIADYRGRGQVRGVVVDAFSESAYGGTGRLADWDLAAEAARTLPVFLAGGLTSLNVAEAIRKVRPYGVDVSSGVEAGPGKKDTAKMQAFIRAARLAAQATEGYTAR
jgi:phosphoribosylanthranilate isomerase